jgi:hypothetical protein
MPWKLSPDHQGKTKLISEFVVPLLVSEEHKAILLVTPANLIADDLAQTVDATIKARGLTLRIVVRLYSFLTEQQIFIRTSMQATEEPTVESGPQRSNEQSDLIDKKVANYVKKFHDHVTYRRPQS